MCVFFLFLLLLGEVCLKCVQRMHLVGFVSSLIRNKLLQRGRIHFFFVFLFFNVASCILVITCYSLM